MLSPDDEVGTYLAAASVVSLVHAYQRSILIFSSCRGDEVYKSGLYLSETLLDPATSHSNDPTETSFVSYYKNPLWIFWKEHPKNFQRFRLGMAGYTRVENMHSIEAGSSVQTLRECYITVLIFLVTVCRLSMG